LFGIAVIKAVLFPCCDDGTHIPCLSDTQKGSLDPFLLSTHISVQSKQLLHELYLRSRYFKPMFAALCYVAISFGTPRNSLHVDE
jgi:hypothetical protein